jgi:serine phosphatase RsbU (regulator of sigma subunit)
LEKSESKRQLLAEHNARLNAEQTLAATREKLQTAATLQKRLLPHRVPQLDGYDFAAVLYPCDETAGDFYDFLMLNDGSLAIVVGDVSGHGIDAALLMSTAMGHLRVLATQCCDAADLLRRLNQLIAQEADGRFVTFFVAQLDVKSGALSYASAGHPGYLIKADGSSQVLDSPCVPLGILPELDVTTSPCIVLQPGQMVLLHTDGLSEATADATGQQFGVSRILEKVAADRTCPADVIVSQLCSEIQRYSSGVGQQDDMTVVIFKLNAP